MSGGRLRGLIGTFLIFQGGLALIASGRARTIDEHSLHFMAESLIERGSLAVPQLVAIRSFYGRNSLRGEPYAPYSPGQPLLASLYLRVLGPALRAAAPRDRGEPVILADEAATGLLNTTLTAAMTVFFLMAATALGATAWHAWACAVLLVVSTPFLPYSKYGFSEPFLGAVGALIAWGLVIWDCGDDRGLWLTGAAVSLAIAVKFAVGGLWFAAVLTALVWRKEGRNLQSLVRVAIGPASILLVHMVWNWVRFGHALDLGYPEAAEMGRRLNDFDTPFLVGLFGLLLSPGKGLVFFAPGVVVAAAGLRAVYRKSRSVVIAGIAFFAGCLALYSRYSAWEGGYCFGPRYLLPCLPLLWIGLPFVLNSRRRTAVLVACALGTLIQLPAVFTSFSEDQMAGGRYYDAAYRYRLDYTPAGQWALSSHYLRGLVSGEGWNQPLGLGLDFWFVFLVRAGFSPVLVIAWLGAGASCLSAGIFLLSRSELVRDRRSAKRLEGAT